MSGQLIPGISGNIMRKKVL